MQRIPTKNPDVDILIIKDEETGDTFAFKIIEFSGQEYLNPEGINLDEMKKVIITYKINE